MYKVILREVAWNLMENIFQISLNFDVALTENISSYAFPQT